MSVRAVLAVCALVGTASAEDARPALNCGGVEPFWSVEISAEDALFSTPQRQIEYVVPDERRAEGRFWPRALTLTAPDDTAIAILRPAECGDTMSDRVYDWTIDFLTQKNGEAVMYTGCCRLAPTE